MPPHHPWKKTKCSTVVRPEVVPRQSIRARSPYRRISARGRPDLSPVLSLLPWFFWEPVLPDMLATLTLLPLPTMGPEFSESAKAGVAASPGPGKGSESCSRKMYSSWWTDLVLPPALSSWMRTIPTSAGQTEPSFFSTELLKGKLPAMRVAQSPTCFSLRSYHLTCGISCLHQRSGQPPLGTA